MLYKIRRKLKENRGEMGFVSLIAFMTVMLIFSVIFESSQRYITAECVKQEFYNALVNNCTDNYANVYDTFREDGEGAYQPTGYGGWTQTYDTSGIYSEVADVTGGTNASNTIVVKDKSGNILYSINNINIIVQNPSTTDEAHAVQYTETAKFTLSMPFVIAGSIMPNITLQMEATAGYTPKY